MSDEQKKTKLELLEEKAAKAVQRVKDERRKESERKRKTRTRRLINLGGLVVKAGMEEIDRGTLLGLLQEGAAKLDDDDTRRRWKLAGDEALNKTEGS